MTKTEYWKTSELQCKYYLLVPWCPEKPIEKNKLVLQETICGMLPKESMKNSVFSKNEIGSEILGVSATPTFLTEPNLKAAAAWFIKPVSGNNAIPVSSEELTAPWLCLIINRCRVKALSEIDIISGVDNVRDFDCEIRTVIQYHMLTPLSFMTSMMSPMI